MKREEVDRRVKEDTETYTAKFSEEAKTCCQQVSGIDGSDTEHFHAFPTPLETAFRVNEQAI